MKKSNFKFFLLATVVSAGVVAASVYSCEKEEIIPNETTKNAESADGFVTEPNGVCGVILEKDIVDQQHKTVGQALIYNDTKYFYVVMSSYKSYEFTDVYMQIDDKYGDFPLDESGNPLLKEFEYSITGQPASHARKFKIPLTEMSGVSHLSVGAKVKMVMEGSTNTKPITVWVDGKFYGSDKIGRSFVFEKTACLTTQGEPVKE